MTDITIRKSCICFPIQPIKVSDTLLKALDSVSVMYSYRFDDELKTSTNIPEEHINSYVNKLYFAWARPHSEIEDEFEVILMFILSDFNIDIKNRRTYNERGFLTSDERFVDRKEAYQIAKKSNQLYREERSEQLYSDNVKF